MANRGLRCFGAEIVVWCSGIPQQKVTRLRADLLPGATVVVKPLHAVFGIAVPLIGPSWDLFLIFHVLVELLGELSAAFTDDKATILRAIG